MVSVAVVSVVVALKSSQDSTGDPPDWSMVWSRVVWLSVMGDHTSSSSR